jgi:hypothetical protein
MTSVSPSDKTALLTRYMRWAEATGLSPHRHDAELRGTFRDVPIEIETGVRESDLYSVVVTLDVRSRVSVHVKRGEEVGTDEPQLARDLRAILDTLPALASVRVDAHGISCRLRPGTAPAAVEAAIDEVLPTVLAAQSEGPYR